MCVPSHHDGLFLFHEPCRPSLDCASYTVLFLGVTSTAAAAVAALVLPLSRKGEGIGYFALSTNLAMVVGPLVGLLLMQYWGPSAVFFFLILGALFHADCYDLQRAAVLCDPSQCLLPLFFSNRSH